jgi:alpha-galactosidase
MKKYPDLWIESCASGGRILDLGMMRRSHSMWVTDFTGFEDGHQDGDVDMCRNVRSGISKFIPSVYIQNGIHVPRAIRNAGEIYPLYNYLSHFAGDLQFGQGLPDWKEEDIKFATYVTSKYKIYRRYLEEDFYQLVPIPKDKTGWDGWQFDDRKSDSGILILFRMQDCESPSFSVPAKGLAGVSNFTYEVILGDGLIGIKDGILVAELKNRRDSMLVYYSRKEDL